MTVLVGTIQERKDTAANWTSANPVLLSGEYGLETDTKKRKLGDGATAWNSLAYYSDPLAEVVTNKSTSVTTDQASNTKFPSVKAVYDWAVGAFQVVLTAASFGAFSSALTGKTTPVDADTVNISDSAASGDAKKVTWLNIKNTLKTYFDTFYENLTNKDATGGYVGLTLFKINFKNAANTFTSFFTNSNTAARTYTFQDRDGTIADDTDLALKLDVASKATSSDVNTGTDNVKYITSSALGGSEIRDIMEANYQLINSGNF